MKAPRTINGKRIKEYTAFAHMRKRALLNFPSAVDQYKNKNYGGMEIQEEWKTVDGYDDFYKEIGPAPTHMGKIVVDRIDNNKGYIKKNIRWADLSTSARNTSRARMITAFGRTQHLYAWAEETGIKMTTIRRRIYYHGWSPEDALTYGPNQRLSK